MKGPDADIIDVAEGLGHANPASVRHYAKHNLKRLEKATAGRTCGAESPLASRDVLG